VCGNPKIIEALAKVKSNIDSGVVNAVQASGIEALKKIDKVTEAAKTLYEKRRNVFVDGLNKLGWKIPKPKATFYVWAPVFGRHTSTTLAAEILEKCSVVVTPGNGFGESGEGYVRMALTVDEIRLKEAVSRIRKII